MVDEKIDDKKDGVDIDQMVTPTAAQAAPEAPAAQPSSRGAPQEDSRMEVDGSSVPIPVTPRARKPTGDTPLAQRVQVEGSSSSNSEGVTPMPITSTTSPVWIALPDAKKRRWDDFSRMEVPEVPTTGEQRAQESGELLRESSEYQAKQQKPYLDPLKVREDNEEHETLPIPPGMCPLSVREMTPNDDEACQWCGIDASRTCLRCGVAVCSRQACSRLIGGMTICTNCLDHDLPGYDTAWPSKVGEQLQFLGWERTKVSEGVSLAGSTSLSYEIIEDAGWDKTTLFCCVCWIIFGHSKINFQTRHK